MDGLAILIVEYFDQTKTKGQQFGHKVRLCLDSPHQILELT